MKKIYTCIILLILIQLSSCLPMSQISFSTAPLPQNGNGVLYIYNLEKQGLWRYSTNILIDFEKNKKPLGRALLNNGEYSWVHLPVGVHSATYVAPDGRSMSVKFAIENGKSYFLQVSQLNETYNEMHMEQETTALNTLKRLKYAEFDFNPEPCFVLTCRKK